MTQCRESGLPDTEIAVLIGDESSPAIIARTCGDVRPEHLLKQVQRVRFLMGVKPDAGAPKFVVPQRPYPVIDGVNRAELPSAQQAADERAEEAVGLRRLRNAICVIGR